MEIKLPGGEVWRPTDATPPTGREMTLRDALALDARDHHGGQPAAAVGQAAPHDALVDMLRSVVDKGTAVAVRQRYGIHADVAGKTGTTQGNADGWLVAVWPGCAGGCWSGHQPARKS